MVRADRVAFYSNRFIVTADDNVANPRSATGPRSPTATFAMDLKLEPVHHRRRRER